MSRLWIKRTKCECRRLWWRKQYEWRRQRLLREKHFETQAVLSGTDI